MSTTDDTHGLPSSICQLDLDHVLPGRRVLIPENEQFRLDDIFSRKAYAIPPRYLPSKGPLTVVDVGANVGLFALYMNSLRPDCRIYCYEPAPPSFALLKQNLAGLDRMVLRNIGLAASDGFAQLHLHPYNSGENSIHPGQLPAAGQVDIRLVNTATALAVENITYVDVLKIDTEGCEVEILKGLGERINYVGIVMAEYHCEPDRRRIDEVLKDFDLFQSHVQTPGLGVVKYINRRLM